MNSSSIVAMGNSEKVFPQKMRHEHKYISPEHILSALQMRSAAIMQSDPHTGGAGFYAIRSVYFDDIYDTCFWENEDGTDPREKFRIRIYNCSKELISLELKQKQNGFGKKISCPISLETCEQILHGEIPDFSDETPPLLKKLICQMHFRALRPVVIVAYERFPFIWEAGNVRVTFDRNVRSSAFVENFFDGDIPFRPIFPSDTNMLEVKFDAFLPDFINEFLQTGFLRQTSFSKYYMCRKFQLGGVSA